MTPSEVTEPGLYWYICKEKNSTEYNELQAAVVDKHIESSGHVYFTYRTVPDGEKLTFTLGYDDIDEVGKDDLFMLIERPSGDSLIERPEI